MSNRNLNAITAGILYLIFAVFATAVLGITWFTPPRFTIDALLSTPGAVKLFSVTLFLLLSSAAMGSYLVIRARANKSLLAASAALACVGFAWNILAVVFWLLPLLFIWRACANKPTNPPLNTDARPETPRAG